MKLTLGRVLADAWTILRREGDLVLRVAAPFLFLPNFAVQLLVAPPPALPQSTGDRAAMQAWAQAIYSWMQANAGWYLLVNLVGIYGMAALTILLIHPARPDVRTALITAARRFGRFSLAYLLMAIPISLGFWLFVLPGLYMQARLIATIPALVVEAPIGAARAVGRSWRVTRGEWWGVLGAVVLIFLAQYLIRVPLSPADSFLRSAGHENPIVLALADAVMAAAEAAYQIAILGVGIAIYRRLVSNGM
ncbi:MULTISPECIES: hypothetical protein [unclassified Sphingomonas]|uniref:hypothetical protein n=1 Tax=unclassified Sphingomonas TaxID=196159 RepID=UPI00092C2F09|nr:MULTISPECIES: hypothetical protein [unclassified Sphingomonas]OJU15870.1 MAG: hypothetical protein BGN95_07745 [Sphingomonas sp. 66-10]